MNICRCIKKSIAVQHHSTSPWASPLHMVPKKDGSWRPCSNFQWLKLVTEPDRYLLPKMLDFADRLSRCTVFPKMDLRKGYWQVPVHPDDIPKTAVITPFGLYEFLRMAFGLCNAGARCQLPEDDGPSYSRPVVCLLLPG